MQTSFTLAQLQDPQFVSSEKILRACVHCGFCTAGILMSLDCFLRQHKRPSEEDIRDLLGGHLCRCTGYTPIVRAALEAAAELSEQSEETADA